MRQSSHINPRLFQSEPIRRCTLAECRAACCLHGTWVDILEAADILRNQPLIEPHLPDPQKSSSLWFDGEEADDDHSLSGKVIHTTVLADDEHYGGTACVFLRPDSKCALQVAAEQNGLHPWRFKPFYCVLHPLDFDEMGRVTLDETESLLEEPASCLRPASASTPFVHTFEAELRYLFGRRKVQGKPEASPAPKK